MEKTTTHKVVRLHGDVPLAPEVLLNELIEDGNMEGIVVIVKRKNSKEFTTYWSHLSVGDLCFASMILNHETHESITESRDGLLENDNDDPEDKAS